MTVSISQPSVQGESGSTNAGEALTAWAQLSNDGEGPVSLEIDFKIDGQSQGGLSGYLDGGQSDWFQSAVGQLAEGGHELEVVVGVDDGQSSSQVDTGFSFSVGAAADTTPTIDVGEVHIQPHSNVEHDPGEAWVGERLRLSVALFNTGQQAATVSVTFDAGSGGSATETVDVAAGAEEWVSTDIEPLEAGTHTITVTASTETDTASVLLGTKEGSVTVTDANAGWRPVNVQVTLHDFRNRPMDGRAVFLSFYGMDGDDAGGAETVEGTATEAGVLTSPGIMIPPRGSMRIMAVSTGEADEPIESTVRYRLTEGQDDLGFTAVQRAQPRTIRARNMQAVRDQLAAEVNAGIEIEVISIGGSVATESETTQEYETEVEWEVRYGQPAFEVTPDAP